MTSSYLKYLHKFKIFIKIFLLTATIILFTVLLYTRNIYAKLFFEDEILAVHPKLGYMYNFYDANFNYFKNSVPCGYFKNGSGFGGALSIALEKNIFYKTHLNFSASYSNKSGELFFDTVYLFRNNQNLIENVLFRNTINSKLYYLELQPDIRFSFIETENSALRFFAGIKFSFPIIANFTQVENILSPKEAYYTNNSGEKFKFRELADGNVGNLRKVNFGTSLGLDNNFKLSNNLAFTQQINFNYNFTNVTTEKSTIWKTHSLDFLLGLRYSFRNNKKYQHDIPKKEKYIEPLQASTTNPEKYITSVETDEIHTPKKQETVVAPIVNLIAGKYSGEIHNKLELLATKPIVNSVFFDNNSSLLPVYLRFEELDSLDYFKKDPLELNNYILPYISSILKTNPDARAIIEGATAGTDFEPKGIYLAQERAEIIKKSLLKFGVDSNRLEIKTRLTPQNLSNNQYPEGVIENQRVDIFIQNAPIQKYIKFVNFSELVVQREYFAEAINTAEIPKCYNLVADSLIFIHHPGVYTFYIRKQITNFAEEKELFNETKLFLSNAQKIVIDTIDYNKLEKINISESYDNFEAIIRFDYNSSKLSNENKQLLKELLEKLPENYTIQVLGNSDALGTIERNEQLVKERSEVTCNYIKSINKNKKIFKIETGVSDRKFPEHTPIGRFLNRSVLIRLKK